MAREEDRVPLTIPVKCVPVGSHVTFEQSSAVWTSDVHPTGTGFVWPLEAQSHDPACSDPHCPYETLKSVLLDNGWIQIQGLHNVPGWEEQKKVLAKVVWFKTDAEGANLQFGVRFNKTKPPIRTSADETALNEIHSLDLDRWKATLQASQKQVLVIDEDTMESERISNLLKASNYAVNTLEGDLAGMAERFEYPPKLVFINPVFGGRLKMDLLESVKEACPDASLVLIADPLYKNDILNSPQFRLANYIFIQPLDIDRIRETFVTSPN